MLTRLAIFVIGIGHAANVLATSVPSSTRQNTAITSNTSPLPPSPSAPSLSSFSQQNSSSVSVSTPSTVRVTQTSVRQNVSSSRAPTLTSQTTNTTTVRLSTRAFAAPANAGSSVSSSASASASSGITPSPTAQNVASSTNAGASAGSSLAAITPSPTVQSASDADSSASSSFAASTPSPTTQNAAPSAYARAPSAYARAPSAYARAPSFAANSRTPTPSYASSTSTTTNTSTSTTSSTNASTLAVAASSNTPASSTSSLTSSNSATSLLPATLALALAAQSSNICPPGLGIVNCFVDPCSVSSCPGVKNARCVSNTCGGCNAVWYSQTGMIPANKCRAADNTQKCPSGQPLKNSQGVELFCGRGANSVQCPQGTACQVDPQDRFAVCCAVQGSSCPPGTPLVNCFVDPCRGTQCPGVNNAKCVSNYCGGCNALWYDSNSNLLTAAQCSPPAQPSPCPPGVPSVQCYVDPCQSTKCPSVSDATCTANYCGACNAIWKNAAGTVLSDQQCNAPPSSNSTSNKCPLGDMPLTNSQGNELFCGRGSNRVQCPPGSLCVIDPQDRFAVCCPSTTCPPGVPTANCFANPCDYAKCPGVQGAKCVPNYCGGCNALWYAPNGGLITDSQCSAVSGTPCPTGVAVVQCFIDPCSVSTCPSVKGAKCSANYCGGCNAVWADANGNNLNAAQCWANDKCPSNGLTVRNSQGVELFCGRGTNSVTCPSFSTCVIDPQDRFAVCCQFAPPPSPVVSSPSPSYSYPVYYPLALLCPDNVPVVSCFIDPCTVSSCPLAPDARCVSNYCGGCNALWYTSNGGLLTDQECRDSDSVICPADKPAVQCFVDPCLLQTCPGVAGARCVSSFCGGCSAQWYDFSGTLLTNTQCEVAPGPVRYLTVRTLAPTEALATWVPPNGTFCGLPYTAEMSYDGRTWNNLPLEQSFSVFVTFPVTARKQFQVRVTPQRGPAVVQTFNPPKGRGKQ